MGPEPESNRGWGGGGVCYWINHKDDDGNMGEEGQQDRDCEGEKRKRQTCGFLSTDLCVTSGFNTRTPLSCSLPLSLSLCLFTIIVPGMNLPRMTAQLAALTSQEQGSY